MTVSWINTAEVHKHLRTKATELLRGIKDLSELITVLSHELGD